MNIEDLQTNIVTTLVRLTGAMAQQFPVFADTLAQIAAGCETDPAAAAAACLLIAEQFRQLGDELSETVIAACDTLLEDAPDEPETRPPTLPPMVH